MPPTAATVPITACVWQDILPSRRVTQCVFLIGDAASSAHRNQEFPQGFYSAEVMLGNVIRHGGEVGICGTRLAARGLGDSDITEGTHRSNLAKLAEWTHGQTRYWHFKKHTLFLKRSTLNNWLIIRLHNLLSGR